MQEPERYGVIELDEDDRVLGTEEKLEEPKSSYAVTGLYLYDGEAPDRARSLTPSERGELEITDLNRSYLDDGKLRMERLGRGHALLDTGTHDSLHAAASFVKTIEDRQGLKIACLEDVAYRMGWIDAEQVAESARQLSSSEYGQYLIDLLEQGSIRHGA